MMLDWHFHLDWHFPSSGRSDFFLQLQVSGYGVEAFAFERMCLLCDNMMDFMFGIRVA